MYSYTLDRTYFDALVDEFLHPESFCSSSLSSIEGLGPVERFEQEIADFSGAQYTLALSSCTVALHVALQACDLGPGDEVIVSAYGWGQTVAAVLMTGATPVFADIKQPSGNIDPASVANLINEKTIAVLVTHMFGLPAEMDSLSKLCKKSNLFLIADAAQAFGSHYNNKAIGAWGDITCFSFGRGKLLTTGEGGSIVTSNWELYEKMVLVSQHPVRCGLEVETDSLRSSITDLNMSYRMPSLSAIAGLAQIPFVIDRINRVRENSAHLSDMLKNNELILPGDTTNAFHVFHTYVVNASGDPEKRKNLVEKLHSQGLKAAPGPITVPLHLRFPFNKLHGNKWLPSNLIPLHPHASWTPNACPVAEKTCHGKEIVIELPKLCTQKKELQGRK